MDLFFTHFVCFATVGTPALIPDPPSKENNERNPLKKSTSKTMNSLKSCTILSKDIVSFGNGQLILCVKPRQMGTSLLRAFLHKRHFYFNLYLNALASGEQVRINTTRPDLHVVSDIQCWQLVYY